MSLKRLCKFLCLGTILGFFFGLVKAAFFIESHHYLKQKMYTLTLHAFTANINRGIILGLVIAVSLL